MSDQGKREKVIKGLECRLDINGSKYKHCLACDYRHDIDHCQWACQTDGILEDALALLKEQEPVEPFPDKAILPYLGAYRCGNCGIHLGMTKIARYCINCGKAVKWE